MAIEYNVKKKASKKRIELDELIDEKKKKIYEIREIEKEMRVHRSNRDALNKEAKELREERNVQLEKRDKINEEVKMNKSLRELLKEDIETEFKKINEKQKEIDELQKKMGNFNANKMRNIASEAQKLEFDLETKPNLKPKKENEMVERLKLLHKQHSELSVISEKVDVLREIKRKVKNQKTNANSFHAKVEELAASSQATHESVIEVVEKLKAINEKSDAAHQRFVEQIIIIREKKKEIDEVTKNLDVIKQELGEETSIERKARRDKKIKEQKKENVKREQKLTKRFAAGSKIEFSDFQFLAEQGKVLKNRDDPKIKN